MFAPASKRPSLRPVDRSLVLTHRARRTPFRIDRRRANAECECTQGKQCQLIDHRRLEHLPIDFDFTELIKLRLIRLRSFEVLFLLGRPQITRASQSLRDICWWQCDDRTSVAV